MADQGKNLDELIEEAEALLEQEKQEKPRKRKKGESKRVWILSRFTDGTSNNKTQVSSPLQKPTLQSSATPTSNSLEGLILKYKVKKRGLTINLLVYCVDRVFFWSQFVGRQCRLWRSFEAVSLVQMVIKDGAY